METLYRRQKRCTQSGPRQKHAASLHSYRYMALCLLNADMGTWPRM